MNPEPRRGIGRLLERRQAESLLQTFVRQMPQLGAALLRADRRLFLSAGNWPDDTLDVVLARAGTGDDGGAGSGDAAYRVHPLRVGPGEMGLLAVRGPSGDGYRHVEDILAAALTALLSQGVEKREIINEALACYREMNLLYRVGETIGGLLDPCAIPQLVLDESRHVIHADAGLVTLGDVAASFGAASDVSALHEALGPTLDELWHGAQAAILTNLGAGTRWSAILWAPLRTADRVLGGIVLGRRTGQPVFVANDEKLLMALAAPSALALHNAHLFADLQQTLSQTLEMKTLMEDVFASIASGVLTTDERQQITLCNAAAARLLGVPPAQLIGRPLRHALGAGFSRLAAIVTATAQRGVVTAGENLTAATPDRGALHLYVSSTPVRDARGVQKGAAVVINDLTEHRKLEAERERIHQTFGRVVAPRVRDRLLAEPHRPHLYGRCQTITVLFADLHGFTALCERMAPEAVFKLLNSYLSLAAEAIFAQEGTLDKFIGDAVMAFWNAPDEQPDHALRAVRAARAIERAADVHRQALVDEQHLQFRIGVSTGEAMVGNVGTAELFNYTVVGDTVNLAQRLESLAAPGRTWLSEATYREVAWHVVVSARRPVQVKGREQPVVVYELDGLRA